MNAYIFGIIGLISGIAAFTAGEIYNRRRFEADDSISDKRIIRLIISIGLCVIAAVVLAAENIDNITALKMMTLIAILPVLAWVDIRKRILPNYLLIILLVLRLIILGIEILLRPSDWALYTGTIVTGVLIGGVIFLPVRMISKGGIGMGDIKLYAVIGCYMGVSFILNVQMISLFLAMTYGFAMMILKRSSFSGKMSLGPFIALGTCFVVFSGIGGF